MNNNSFRGEPDQLQLDFKEPREKINLFSERRQLVRMQRAQSLTDLAKTSGRKQITQRTRGLTLGAIITTSILLFIAVFEPRKEPTSTGIAQNFVGIEPTPISPIQRNLPSMPASKKSPLFQLGLFRHLKGAENKQSELITLGLFPGVLKKVTGDGTMYALVISPENENDYKLTMEILKANNIDYFPAKRSGS